MVIIIINGHAGGTPSPHGGGWELLSADSPTNSWPPLSPGSADFAGCYDNDVRMSLAHVWEDRKFLAGL